MKPIILVWSGTWMRVGKEGAVIVISILLALAANAWYDNRKDRIEEQVEIQGLYDQLVVTREILVTLIENDEENVANSQHLIDLIEASEGMGRASVPDSVLRAVSFTTYFDPPLGRFESIVSSGRLSLIQDDALRAAVAGWPNIALSPGYAANSRREMFRNQLIPHLVANYDVNAWLLDTPNGENIEFEFDGTLVNLIKTRVWLDQVVLDNEVRVLAVLDELMGQLEAAKT